MEDNRLKKIKEKIVAVWQSVFFIPDEEGTMEVGKEKIIVFVVALILSFSLWLMINLSRDYNLNANLPIELGNVPPGRALAEELPDFATVSVSGEGWKLISLYNNPPSIYVDVTQDQVNLFDQIQQQMNALPEVSVQKVQPLLLNVNLENKVVKKVPVVSKVKVTFDDRYGFVGEPRLRPDSITVSGAVSMLREIKQWQTDSLVIDDVSGDISQPVDLVEPNALLELSRSSVTYEADVEQFTEGEAKIFVQTLNLPQGRNVSFSPSSITVKYDVPIDEYNEVKDLENIFTAYVNYAQLQRDSSGFVAPQIELREGLEYHIRVRSFQPSKVAYFMVIGN